MYTNPFLVKSCTPLFSSIVSSGVGTKSFFEKDFLRAILKGDSIIDLYLKPRYITPITKISSELCSGTISTTKVTNPDETQIESPYNTIIGTNTQFISELNFGDVIFIKNSKEALEVEDIISNTELRVSSNANFTASGSEFFVIPSDIVTASTFKACQLMLMFNFSEQEYSQDTRPFFEKFNSEVKPILTRMEDGDFFDSTLEERSISQNSGRFFKISNTNKTLNDEFIKKQNSFL